MARPDTPILNRLEQVNHGRSELTGESSGRGYLGSLRTEPPIVDRKSTAEKCQRLPEKDTADCYAFKTGPGSYRLILKNNC
jgi:hypothetical protein